MDSLPQSENTFIIYSPSFRSKTENIFKNIFVHAMKVSGVQNYKCPNTF